MSGYKLDFSDVTVPSIEIDENTVDNISLDITLFGFTRLNYGRELNENFVHILENFAVPEDESNSGNPDLSQVSYDGTSGTNFLLNKPIEGQIWYNKTASQLRPYVRFNNEWNPLENFGQDVAANWGQIANGEQIPQPVSESGYVFPYEECSWIVTPFNQLNELEDMVCRTDDNANVIMEYLYEGDSVRTDGIANYMIVGLKDNNNNGVLVTPEPQPSPTPTPTPSTSSGASPTPTPTNTPTPTPTPSQSGAAQPQPLNLTMFDPYVSDCDGSCTASYIVGQGSDYTISGGSGSYSYDWDFFSGSSFSISNGSSASTILSRYRSEGNINVSGIGRLTITDTVTGDSVSELFEFVTSHNLIDVTNTPTPTPTNTPTPTPTNTPTPTPTNTPTPTPTPTPSESSAPVNLEADSPTIVASQVCTGGAGSIGGNVGLSVSSGTPPFNFTITDFTISSQNGPISSGPTGSLGSVNTTTGTANLAVTYSYSNGNTASGAEGEITVEVEDGNGNTDTTTVVWLLTKCQFGI